MSAQPLNVEDSTATIMVVEDNPDIRQLVQDVMMAHGHKTVSYGDGREVLRAAEEDRPDLVILDVNIPGISGFEVCRQLKAHASLSDIPVLMLTALTDVNDRVQGLGLGADDYLTKPFNTRELAARVDARLRAKHASDDLRAARDQIQATFERYVAPTVVEQLLENPTDVALTGQIQTVTALFADIEGFTAIAEHTDPEQLFTVLNGYLSHVADAVFEEHGTLDKFLGDGLMALFNVPLPQSDHALRAVQAAMDAQKRVETYRASLEPSLQLRFRIGIHSGDAVVGNVGAMRLRNYTAIGDTINTASRLEKSAEAGQVLITEETYEAVQEQVEAEKLGPRTFKGRAQPVIAYAVKQVKTS